MLLSPSSCLAVLAGGASNRIGEYKPLIVLDGKTLIETVLDNLAPSFSSVLVVVRSKQQKEALEKRVRAILDKYNARVLLDCQYVEGPLAGICAALTNCNCEELAISPVDMPFLSAKVYRGLEAYLNNKYDAAIPIWPNGYIEPLVAVARKHSLNSVLKQLVRAGIWQVSALFRRMNTVYVSVARLSNAPDVDFMNINTLDDLAVARRIIRNLGIR